MEAPRAIHLPGGNAFDDVRLDIASSVAAQEQWLSETRKQSVRRSRARDWAAIGAHLVERRAGWRSPLVDTGLRRQWFDEFHRYWRESVGGRPLEVSDFHALRFHYRARAQQVGALEWDDSERHVANWQTPDNIAATFQLVYRSALRPVRSRLLPRLLKPNASVLEFGASLAPMYRTWRAFFPHVPSQWLLVDLATFPFHYARHTYGRDAEARLHVISPSDLDDPLPPDAGPFDLVCVQEVFEHLHAPLQIAEYLLDRIRPGGWLLFDYLVSEARGHDTPAGLAEREATLELLRDRLDVVHGELRIDDASLGTVAGRVR